MIDKELVELKRELERIQVEPKKYNILDIINKVYDENIISNWLGFLFNANINGIGNEPVMALLKAVGCESIILENEAIEYVGREERN